MNGVPLLDWDSMEVVCRIRMRRDVLAHTDERGFFTIEKDTVGWLLNCAEVTDNAKNVKFDRHIALDYLYRSGVSGDKLRELLKDSRKMQGKIRSIRGRNPLKDPLRRIRIAGLPGIAVRKSDIMVDRDEEG